MGGAYPHLSKHSTAFYSEVLGLGAWDAVGDLAISAVICVGGVQSGDGGSSKS